MTWGLWQNGEAQHGEWGNAVSWWGGAEGEVRKTLWCYLRGSGWEPVAIFPVLWSPSWSLGTHRPRGRLLNSFALWLNVLRVLGVGRCVYKHLPCQVQMGWCIYGNNLPNSEKPSFSNIFSILSTLHLSFKYNLNLYLNLWRLSKASHMLCSFPVLYHNVEE